MLRTIGSHLARAGHEVSITTAQPSYKGNDKARRAKSNEILDGINVTRLPHLPMASRIRFFSLLQKALFPVRACVRTVISAWCGVRDDVIIAATIPPVANGFFALVCARLTGAKLVYHLQDIYPEIGVAGNLWSPRSLRHRFLEFMDSLVTRHADCCIVLSSDMEQALLARRVSPRKVVVLNNLMLTDFGDVSHAVRELPGESLEEVGSDTVVRLVFAGNLGRFQGLEAIVEAFLKFSAIQTTDQPTVELHFLGEGVVLETLKKMAADSCCVKFHGHKAFADAAQLIATCDAGIVSIGPEIYKYAYPSKTLTYLGLGVPVLAVVEPESALAASIENHGLGIVAPARDLDSLVLTFQKLAEWLASDTDRHERVSTFFKEEFSSVETLTRWEGILEELDSPANV